VMLESNFDIQTNFKYVISLFASTQKLQLELCSSLQKLETDREIMELTLRMALYSEKVLV
jgi:hypothetical protein